MGVFLFDLPTNLDSLTLTLVFLQIPLLLLSSGIETGAKRNNYATYTF